MFCKSQLYPGVADQEVWRSIEFRKSFSSPVLRRRTPIPIGPRLMWSSAILAIACLARGRHFQPFSVVKPGGVIFRHDYGSAKGPTRFWDWLTQDLPVSSKVLFSSVFALIRNVQ